MQRFYANLLRGRPGLTSPMPKAEALHEAKLWLRGLRRAELLALTAEMSGGVERGKCAKARTPAELAAATPAGGDNDRPYAHPHFWAAREMNAAKIIDEIRGIAFVPTNSCSSVHEENTAWHSIITAQGSRRAARSMRVLAVRLTALASHARGLPGMLAKTVQPVPHEVTHAREMRLLSWLSNWLFWIRTSCSIG
jgi:hypothetical protein